jgi:predicted nuclease of predicted toxin-antitoxin system
MHICRCGWCVSFERGFDAVHTSEFPEDNATKDSFINRLSVEEQRVVVTKDSDFSDTFVMWRVPYKLLLVATGNINNTDLEALFLGNLEKMAELLKNHSFIELGRDSLVVHV